MKHAKLFLLLGVGLFIAYMGIHAGTENTSTGPDDKTAEAMIDGMLEQWELGKPVPFLTPVYGDMTIDRAYEIQAMYDKKVARRLGPPSGYKVGYASKAAQKQFGMDEPARGTFFLSRCTPNGTTLMSKDIMESALETEVAFTMKSRIKDPVKDVASLRQYVQWVHASFDIGEFRFESTGPKGGVPDMVASGVGAHYFMLGPGKDPEKIDVNKLILKLARNGDVIRESPASEVMGNPWNSLLWCVNDVIKRGGVIQPGMVILTGTAAPGYRASGEELKGVYEGDCGPLGKVTLEIQ